MGRALSWLKDWLWSRASKLCHSWSKEGDLTPCHVLCGSVALRPLGRRAKFYVLYSQMSDVEAGGATVFPDLGAAIWPKKVSSGSCESDIE